MENLKPAGVELRAVIQAVVSVLQCVKIFPDKKIAEGFWLVKMKPLSFPMANPQMQFQSQMVHFIAYSLPHLHPDDFLIYTFTTLLWQRTTIKLNPCFSHTLNIQFKGYKVPYCDCMPFILLSHIEL